MTVAGAMIKKKTSGPQAFLQAEAAYATADAPGTATAGMRFTSSGGVDSRINGTYTGEFTWLLSGAAADYQIRAVLSSGTTPAGPSMGAWSALSTTREWYVDRSATPGVNSSVISVDIRRVSDSVVVAGPVNYTLDAEVLDV